YGSRFRESITTCRSQSSQASSVVRAGRSVSAARRSARRRADVNRRYPAAAISRLPAATAGLDRAVRWVAAFCIVASSVGCVLTQDIPDPALDIPGGYKLARAT